mgnify:CR=1 FL=1
MVTRILAVLLATAAFLAPAEMAIGDAVWMGALGLLFVAFAVEGRLGRFGPPLSWTALVVTVVLSAGIIVAITTGPPVVQRNLGIGTVILVLLFESWRRVRARRTAS